MSTAAVWQDSDATLVAELAALEIRLHSTWAQMLSVVAEIDSPGTAATLGYPTLPATAVAVAEHAIGAADVKAIRSILARLPPHLGDDTRAEVEAELAHHARTLDAGQLTVLGKRILAYLDQDGPRPHDPAETRRHLRFRDRDGRCELAGWLDRDATEILRAARRRRPGRLSPTVAVRR
ncbi:MAG TPA: DUF222 domain-containing protein [Pseudonocardiaceae bacterium]|jgi:hypothetical protein|nr:DUF222 domain-containing protein [Pseudonocardiaceae bacterium]